MEVRRITDQSLPLTGHYSGLANDPGVSPHYAEVGRRILGLLGILPAIEGPPVWAVTSHADLHLVATDDYRQKSLVAIRGDGFGEAFSFGIEYPVPAGEAPWPGARMLLSTQSTLEACELVAHALSQATGAAYKLHNHADLVAAAAYDISPAFPVT